TPWPARATAGSVASARTRSALQTAATAITSIPPGSMSPGTDARRATAGRATLTRGTKSCPMSENGARERADRHHRDVPPHDLRARGGGHHAAARPDCGAAAPVGPDGQPDRGPDGA